MVYIRNIISLHQELQTGEGLELRFKSGRKCLIKPDNELSTCNGDLMIITHTGVCVIVDTAEVESVVKADVKIIKGEL